MEKERIFAVGSAVAIVVEACALGAAAPSRQTPSFMLFGVGLLVTVVLAYNTNMNGVFGARSGDETMWVTSRGSSIKLIS
jgi:hypothetical protein